MIIIIHGDDVTSSRKKLNELLLNVQAVDRFDARKSSVDDIITATRSQELFIEIKTILIENFTAISPKGITSLSDVFKPTSKQKEINIYVWHDDVLSAALLKKFPFAEIQLFPLPKYFFQFLDSFAPQEGKYLHSLLFKLYPDFAAEQILYALIKRVRQLLMIQTGEQESFSEIRAMQPWQRGKLSQQARRWTQDQLIQSYKRLFDLEVGLKTSSLSSDLINHLDIMLLTKL